MSRKFEKRGGDVRGSRDDGRAGYCQVCGVYFNDLADHARSSQHGPYPPIQYPQLESIFDYCDLDNMGCLRKSLRIVKSPPSDIFEKPSLELPVVTMNGHVPRSNIDKAALYNGFFSSERSSYDRSDSPDDDDDEDDDEIFMKDVSSDETDRVQNRRTRQSKKSTQVRRNRISRKRLSVEEKLIEDNKSYYRVEVLNSKLRSTEYFINQKQLESRVSDGTANSSCSDEAETSREAQQPISKELNHRKEPVVVRFKKVRKSQLSVLSDEAESFMFGDTARREARKVYSSPAESSDRDSDVSSSADDELPKIRKMVTDSDGGSPVNKGGDSLDSLSSPPMLTCDHDSVSDSEEEDVTEDVSNSNISLDSITFSFENPPKQESWIKTYKRQREEKSEFHYPYHHEYPKVLLPYEYSVSDRLKLMSGKRLPGFGRRRGRRVFDDGKPRKSPRCHASTLAVMSNFLRRPLRECSKTSDFTYEEESRSSLPDTIDTSSSTSEFRAGSSFMSDTNDLPIDPNGDVYAVALARVACGETSSFQVDPGPCLAVSPSVFDKSLSDMSFYMQPGLRVPLEAIVEKYSYDTSWMEHMDYSCDYEQETAHNYYQQSNNTEVEEKTYTKNDPYCWPELPLRRRRKRIRKQEDSPVVPPVIIKCEPCEIKLEPMSAKILEQFSVKEDQVSVKRNSVLVKEEPQSDAEEPLPVPQPIVKRGRGRPRKKVPSINYESPSTEISSLSQHPPTKTYLKKSTIPRFSFIQRSFINQIV